MKKYKKAVIIAAAVLALITVITLIIVLPKSEKAEEPSESAVTEETSVQSSAEPSNEPSKQESSKPKKASSVVSKPSEVSLPGDRYVNSANNVRTNFSDLLSQNPDTIGWLNMPYSVVDYPVMHSDRDPLLITQSEDPYYLCRDFYLNNILSGSIFMDYRSKLDSKNLILHGHSMANGSMFAHILDYNSFSVYENAPVLTYNTLKEAGKWKIIAVVKTNMLDSHGPYFDYMRGDFGSDYDFLEFIYQLRVRSIIDCPVTVNENDKIMTLSTCAYDFDDFRMFIVARKVRDGEDPAVNVGRAKMAANPLYPDVWYWNYGGTKPEVTSFQDALNKKKISWYDGTKKWSQKDDDELPKMLAQKKSEAVKKLQNYYEPSDYYENELNYIKVYVDAYAGFINDAKNTGRVNALTYQCMAVIDSVQMKPEEERAAARQAAQEKKAALSTAKKNALSAMKKVVAGNTYRPNQQAKIQKLMTMYTEQINAADNIDTVKKLQSDAVGLLDAIQTDAEITAKEQRTSNKKKT